jgi:dihydropteroate synthase
MLATSLNVAGKTFVWGVRTYVMGVVNCTPDSFAGDGLSDDVEAAVAQARRMIQEGADIIDVGGESTRPGTADPSRPGFDEVQVEDELRRVIPVIERLAREVDEPISIDTYKATVARKALAAGAHIVNDIWGFHHDADMAKVVAETGVPAIVMHNQRGRQHRDVIGDIVDGLNESIGLAESAGVAKERLIIDPGFGFGWQPEQNLEMIRRLAELKQLGLPVLVGTSRKSTIGRVLGGLPVEERLEGTLATVALAIANGADVVRVHDVKATVRVARMADAIVRGNWRGESK